MGTESQAAGPTIFIDFEGSITLTVNEVWPDGDAPEVITAEAVKAVLLAGGSKRQVFDDWCLLGAVDVSTGVMSRGDDGKISSATERVW